MRDYAKTGSKNGKFTRKNYPLTKKISEDKI